MDKRVLLIGDQKSFMVTAISNGLEREEFEVVRIGNSVKEISHVEEAPKMWVFYLDGDVEELSEALVYCKDIILQDEIFFYLVGNQEELTEAKNYVTGDLVRAELERPLNIQKLVDQLLIGVQDGEEIEAKKRVLIVDDDPAMTRMIKNLLTPKYNVFMAGSGMNAITFLAKNTVDLILLDYEMPVVSGAKVLEMIRSEPRACDSIDPGDVSDRQERQRDGAGSAGIKACEVFAQIHEAERVAAGDRRVLRRPENACLNIKINVF